MAKLTIIGQKSRGKLNSNSDSSTNCTEKSQ